VDELARHFEELEILGMIGRGGMGAVYKVRQKSLDRLAALKILPAQIADSPEFPVRFARESQALARLSHPHIVAVYDSGQRRGLFFFLMEYVDGPNLRQLLQDSRLAPEQALAIVPQICEALQHAHDQGIVHRDIKPENILLNRQGEVKIADFGLVKLMGATAQEFTLTQNRIMGTPAYMAPEQIEHPDQVDHRADIYSLGVVFYQMLTGELPMGRFAPPSRKVQIDVRLDEVVLRTLERERERRYQRAAQVKTDVQTIVSGAPASAMHPHVGRWKAPAFWALAIIVTAGTLIYLGWKSWELESGSPGSDSVIPITSRPSSPSASAVGGPFFLPADWISIQALERVDNVVYMGGAGADRSRFGLYDIKTGDFVDLSSLLPPMYNTVHAMDFGKDQLVVGGGSHPAAGIGPATMGIFFPDISNFLDLTAQMRRTEPYTWGLHTVVFNGNEFLIGGAGGLTFYSPGNRTFRGVSRNIPYYFAVNNAIWDGGRFLIDGAGAGPGGEPGTPPALGWVAPDGSFVDLTPCVPVELGVMCASAFNGDRFLIQGFNTHTAAQMLELFDPSNNSFKDVTRDFPTSLNLRCMTALNGRFLLAGQLHGKGYLAAYDPAAATVTSMNDALPPDVADVTAITISAGKSTIGGIDGRARAFTDLLDPALLKMQITLPVASSVGSSVNQIQAAARATRITSVAFSGVPYNYTVSINGVGFGSLPNGVPFDGVTPYFRLFEVAQLGAGEWGYPGDARTLAYHSWSGTQIQISGLSARPGDAVQIWFSNPTTGLSATWGGNVPGGSGNPRIDSVSFSGSAANLHVTIDGLGFGDAPATMPFTGDLDQFIFADQRTHSGTGAFEAGGQRWGHGQPDPVTVKFQSWSDNQIVIDGFAGSYGQGDANMIQSGDPVYIVIWRANDTSQAGPQTAWGGFVSTSPTTSAAGPAR
jgi:serine/threonine protein kinase